MRLHERMNKQIIPALQKELGLKTITAVPRLEKVVLHVGAGRATQDPKLIDVYASSLTRISGQKPLITRAKKSISNFKIRENMPIGLKVTLRGKRMYDFVEKLVQASLPRIRDFRGLPLKGFDGKGNYVIGIREHIVFPEIRPDEVEHLHGLEICFSTTATNDDDARKMFVALGFPFQKTSSS